LAQGERFKKCVTFKRPFKMKQTNTQKQEPTNPWIIATIILAICVLIFVINIQWKQDKIKGETIQIGKFSINNNSLNALLSNYKVGDVVSLCDIDNKICTRVRLLKQLEQ
jgi:hypothetical protein